MFLTRCDNHLSRNPFFSRKIYLLSKTNFVHDLIVGPSMTEESIPSHLKADCFRLSMLLRLSRYITHLSTLFYLLRLSMYITHLSLLGKEVLSVRILWRNYTLMWNYWDLYWFSHQVYNYMQLGSTAIGIKTKDGVVLAVEKRITSPLLVSLSS